MLLICFFPEIVIGFIFEGNELVAILVPVNLLIFVGKWFLLIYEVPNFCSLLLTLPYRVTVWLPLACFAFFFEQANSRILQ